MERAKEAAASLPEILRQRIPFLGKGFEEQLVLLPEIMRLAADILRMDPRVAKQFHVTLNPLPDYLLTFPYNMISATCLGVLHALGVAPERRMVYGKLNHMFRAWVTSADNLLDGEDKVTLPVQLPGDSVVMRQVIVIMLADRIMNRVLAEAQANGIFTADEARTLSDESLRILLPSAAEEASEEGGVKEWPEPEYVLAQIHPLKTGTLFRIPLLGPQTIERNVNPEQVAGLRSGLLNFAVAVQMLDDLRDMARDFTERRANYVISVLAHGPRGKQAEELLRRETQGGDLDKRLDHLFPTEAAEIAEAAIAKMYNALTELDHWGFKGFASVKVEFSSAILYRMDLAQLVPSLK